MTERDKFFEGYKPQFHFRSEENKQQVREWHKDMKIVENFKFAQTLVNGIQPMFHGQFKMPEPIEYALEYWLQHYAAEKEQTELWREHVRKSNIDLEAAEAREKELREAIKRVIFTDGEPYPADYLESVLASLYPKEEEAK
ncbi:hypothetical protein D3C74_151470 [compost metagenome]